MTAAKERIVAYDLLRVFAAVSVVTIHVFAPFMKTAGPFNPMNWVSLFDRGLFYAVPVFMFLAGVLSWGAPWKGGPGAYAGFVRRRMLAVGVPYLAWCVLFYVLRPAGGQGTIPGSPLGIVRDFVELVVSGRMWFHLYFVPMLIVLYLLTPLAARAVRRAPEVFVALALVAIVYGGSWLTGHWGSLPLHRTLGRAVLPLLQSLTVYAPFMVVGAWYGVRRVQLERFVRWGAVPLLALATGIHVYATAHPPVADALLLPAWLNIADKSLFALGFLGIALLVADRPVFAPGQTATKYAEVLSAATLGVYLMHPLVVTFVGRQFLGALGFGALWHSLWFTLAFDAFTVVVCFGIAIPLKRFKPTRHLV